MNLPVLATATALENGGLDDVKARSWSYCALGFGHDLKWWSDFCYRLRMVGYDGWLSIEHEDFLMSREEGLTKAVNVLRAAGMFDTPNYDVQAI
jgi:sugar phosphate isomerase/epimerase